VAHKINAPAPVERYKTCSILLKYLCMGLNVRKNVQFTKLIKAPAQLKEFNFRKLNAGEELFHVDVNDDRGNRIMFNMKLENGEWKIADNIVPKWISDAEAKLNDAIEEEIQK
jgi:hypothetical protein